MADGNWMDRKWSCNDSWWVSNNNSWGSVGNGQDTSDSELQNKTSFIYLFILIHSDFTAQVSLILTNLNILIGFFGFWFALQS